MRALFGWLVAIVVLAAIGATVFAVWWFDWRWRPHTVAKHQDEIAQALQQSGWVSPHLTGPKLYLITFRADPGSIDFETQEFPKLQAASIDTRVIAIARPDVNGQSNSTAAERATVAELWINRSWRLFQQWTRVPPDAWTAPGLAPADGDAARTAVVEAGRSLLGRLTPLLKDNGVAFAYPTLVWWTKDGRMRAASGDNPRTWRHVEAELEASSSAGG
jgi:hypothetical protein